MPVEDHPIHPMTQFGDDFRYGCNNDKPMSAGYWAPHRIYNPDGSYVDAKVFIEHQNSTDCKSRWLWETDPACAGCPKRN